MSNEMLRAILEGVRVAEERAVEAFVNVNIGIGKNSQGWEGLAQRVQAAVDAAGGSWDNDGSDESTHNINAGFSDEATGREFASTWEPQVDYLETESFPEMEGCGAEMEGEKELPMTKGSGVKHDPSKASTNLPNPRDAIRRGTRESDVPKCPECGADIAVRDYGEKYCSACRKHRRAKGKRADESVGHTPDGIELVEDSFKPQEVAYRMPGKGWQRKTVKTQAQLDKLPAKLDDEGAEKRVREVEAGSYVDEIPDKWPGSRLKAPKGASDELKLAIKKAESVLVDFSQDMDVSDLSPEEYIHLLDFMAEMIRVDREAALNLAEQPSGLPPRPGSEKEIPWA